MTPITDPVLIYGTTQPGYDPSTGAVVRYDGDNLSADGFTVQPGGSGTVIKGLVMTRWNTNAIRILGNNTAVAGNWLGVPSTGPVNGLGNGISVLIEGGNDNIVGGTTTVERNVIGQSSYGVRIHGTDPSGDPKVGNTDGNQVLGNYLGLRDDGTSAVGNSYQSTSTWRWTPPWAARPGATSSPATPPAAQVLASGTPTRSGP